MFTPDQVPGLMPGERLEAEKIVSATEGLLGRHGPDMTTVLDVARLLGVSHGRVYRHFPSKAALREAVVRRWLGEVLDSLAAAIQDPRLTPPGRLRALLTALFAVNWKKKREDPELLAMSWVVTAEHSTVASSHVDFLLPQIRAIVADGIASGDFAAGEPEVIGRAIFNATSRFRDPRHAEEWLPAQVGQASEISWRRSHARKLQSANRRAGPAFPAARVRDAEGCLRPGQRPAVARRCVDPLRVRP